MPAGLAFNRSYTENSRRRVESDTGAFVISKGWVSFYEFAVSSVTGLVAQCALSRRRHGARALCL